MGIHAFLQSISMSARICMYVYVCVVLRISVRIVLRLISCMDNDQTLLMIDKLKSLCNISLSPFSRKLAVSCCYIMIQKLCIIFPGSDDSGPRRQIIMPKSAVDFVDGTHSKTTLMAATLPPYNKAEAPVSHKLPVLY